MTNRRRLSPAELKVWRKVARTVKPYQRARTPHPEDEDFPRLLGDKHHMDAPKSRPKPPLRAPHPNLAAKTAPTPAKGPAADRAGERRVRRGQIEVDASLDLHGHTQDSAHMALLAFVAFQRLQGARCVLVITGKGKAGEGVIRKRFLDWLNGPDVRAHVSSYAQAHQRHGGAGAFYVFLKRRDRRR